jgi:uncharacterized damage-inducible protein DinB
MTDSIQSMIRELEQEAISTRRLLSLVPEEKLNWAPHSKSMSLGQLALHIATVPGSVANMLVMDEFDALKAKFDPPQPESKEQILSTLETGLERAKQILGDWDQQKAMSLWRLSKGQDEVFTMPRSAVARNVLLNHWYHHRGQLTVYLRLLDVPLPVTYGRSADENPFA